MWRILLENKLAIFSVDNTFKTPLMWASIRGHSDVTEFLLEMGADINREDINGFNALYFAIKYDQAECVKVLMLQMAGYDKKHISL